MAAPPAVVVEVARISAVADRLAHEVNEDIFYLIFFDLNSAMEIAIRNNVQLF